MNQNTQLTSNELSAVLPGEKYEEFKSFHNEAPEWFDKFKRYVDLQLELSGNGNISELWRRFIDYLGLHAPRAFNKGGGGSSERPFHRYYMMLLLLHYPKYKDHFTRQVNLDVDLDTLLKECPINARTDTDAVETLYGMWRPIRTEFLKLKGISDTRVVLKVGETFVCAELVGDEQTMKQVDDVRELFVDELQVINAMCD